MDLTAALNLAVTEFRKTDPNVLPERSGAILEKDGAIVRLTYLHRDYCFSLPEITWQTDASPREKVLILNYLARSTGRAATGKLVDFRQVPGGNIYYPVFAGRVHRALVKHFGAEPGRLVEAGRKLGGRPADGLTGFSLILPVFPRVFFTVIIYPAEETLPGAAKLLFDANITDYLSSEEITVAAEDAVRKLAGAL